MYYLVMDLETAPNKDIDWAPPEDDPKAFPPIPCHRIVCNAGLLIELSKEYNRCKWIGTFGDPGNERSAITDFIEQIREYRPSVVTFNGRNFDMALIMYRAMHYGIPFPEHFNDDFAYRYKWNRHIDLSDKLTGHGASWRAKLDYYAQLIGLPGKFDVAGDDVFELVEKGELETVYSYGQCDVIQEAYVLLRLMHVMGKIATVTHNNLLHSIKSKALAKNDAMITKLIESIDWSVLEIEFEKKQPEGQGALFGEEKEEESDPDIPF